jgi:hypothetical protein
MVANVACGWENREENPNKTASSKGPRILVAQYKPKKAGPHMDKITVQPYVRPTLRPQRSDDPTVQIKDMDRASRTSKRRIQPINQNL